jgi:short-subunit dehydrogenase
MSTAGTPFAGQTVWITGASSGIGAALAQAFSRLGARLILSARREDRLAEVAAACERSEDHLVVPLDLSDTASVEAAAQRVLAERGAVDVMVHSAGVSQRSLARETRIEVDRRLIEVNYLGTVQLTKLLLPSMLERGSGRFVVVTSLVGKISTPLRSSYSASKHALHGFFEALRAECWEDGLRVTLICPGFVRTEISYSALTGDGSPQGTLDEAQAQGMAPEVCAEEIVRAVLRDREEALVGGRERFAVLLWRVLPGVYRRLIRRLKVT